jgi:hypothetical protein
VNAAAAEAAELRSCMCSISWYLHEYRTASPRGSPVVLRLCCGSHRCRARSRHVRGTLPRGTGETRGRGYISYGIAYDRSIYNQWVSSLGLPVVNLPTTYFPFAMLLKYYIGFRRESISVKRNRQSCHL